MVVISISVTESEEQIVAGIPKTVTLSTNVPTTIFYTLDGVDPTLASAIYTGPITLPIDSLSVTLKVLATNGTDYSPIIEEIYLTNMLGNTRLPHSATDSNPGDQSPPLYPFGTPPLEPNGKYLSPGDAGITVDDPALAQISDGYDGDFNPNNFTNEPFNVENYSIKYSESNVEGERGPGIGNLPANVTIEMPTAPPEETNQFSNTFDPRAFVIFQDFTQENPEDPTYINRQFFSLENPERARDGVSYYNSGLDAPPVSGSFLRSHYNPRTNEMTYYYFDSTCNRWIISKTPYRPTGSFDGNLSQIKFGKNNGGCGMVFEWLPFARRVLF